MNIGWRCPSCDLVLAPHVNAHRCDEPGTGEAAKPVPSDPVPVTTAGGALPGYTCAGCCGYILFGQNHYCPGLMVGTGTTGVNTSYFVACPSCGVLTNDLSAHQCVSTFPATVPREPYFYGRDRLNMGTNCAMPVDTSRTVLYNSA